MHYLFIGGTVVLCYSAWRLRLRLRKLHEAEHVPLSDIERKLAFIRDVCDGNVKRAEALVQEQMAIDTHLSHEQAVDLVYADMLELTVDERTAIEKHHSRRAA